MSKIRNDYTVFETTDRYHNPRWQVLEARETVISTCRTLKDATIMAAKLNLDPYALARDTGSI